MRSTDPESALDSRLVTDTLVLYCYVCACVLRMCVMCAHVYMYGTVCVTILVD